MKDDTKGMLISLGTIATIGALTGLGLSFTALSPLVMGGIVGSIAPALIINLEKDGKKLCFWSIVISASAAIGVGLAAAATAVFPGAMLGMGSTALAGAIIAPIAVIAGLLVISYIIEPIAKKVNEYIISPIVERFSSKEEECNLPAK
ncbi:hypothetical protein [Wolbachia endosymbiont of Bemisia tabaci]|uniref:hypothetical protein n=1 Tax=Wolbachia endosymbiont of Bemisia tabaci TaxID=215173 RepID=UPI000D5595B7|nr:hypothetical protein [Wolbachia endosymbiont of Bemisia tabaci]